MGNVSGAGGADIRPRAGPVQLRGRDRPARVCPGTGVHGAGAGHGADGYPPGHGVHRKLHERAHRRPAPRGRRGKGAQGGAGLAGAGGSGVACGEAPGGRRRSGQGVHRGRFRVARGGLLDVPGHESGHPAADVCSSDLIQQELRRTPGQGRQDSPGEPRDGSGGRGHRTDAKGKE